MESDRWILMYNENRAIFDYCTANNVTEIIELFLKLNEALKSKLKQQYNLTDEYMDKRLKERMM